MTDRRLPVRPNLDQLKHQAKELLDNIRQGDPAALAELNRHYLKVPPTEARLADAQLALARSYQALSWPRLVEACKLVDAIWRDDVDAVREIISKNPKLLHEEVLIRRDSNWGPPLTYSANLGRDRIIKMLYQLGSRDLESAIGRAVLQSKISTARMLYEMLGSPAPPDGALGGPAYTLSVSGTAAILEFGGRLFDDEGRSLAPVDVVLETDSRNPSAKHQILEMYVERGVKLPHTPTMALHRGRMDLLEEHLRRDPQLLERTFSHEEIYPPELGCHDEILATHGTPLAGTTLLHMCVDYDEIEIARWLLERGMNVNTRAAVDKDGFGGHTALFSTVVSQPNFWMNYGQREQVAPFTELLLKHGANPNVRASLRKKLHPGYGPEYDVDNTYEYRDVTPIGWGRQFHAKVFVSEVALKMIEEAGGVG
jgi:hypothetical protein